MFDISPRIWLAMLCFIVIGAIVGSAMAASGGWRALAIWYPTRAKASADEETYRFVSLRTSGGLLGTASYSSCVEVGVGSAGISMAMWAPFRLYHPPLLIPWDAVERCRLIEMVGGELVQFAVSRGGTVTVRGAAGTAILRHAAQRGITEGSPSAWW